MKFLQALRARYEAYILAHTPVHDDSLRAGQYAPAQDFASVYASAANRTAWTRIGGGI